MRKVVFFGQCQAAYMGDVYSAHVADPDEESVTKIDSNFDIDAVGLEALAAADVVVTGIYETAKFTVTPDVAPRAIIVAFPTAAFQPLWPFGRSAHPKAPDLWFHDKGWQTFYGDDYINRLLRKGMSPDEAVDAYLAVDVLKVAHLDRQYDLAIEMQQQRDAQADLVDLAALIERSFRDERLFKIPTHPLNTVFLETCGAVFERLGASRSAIARMRAANQYPVIAGDFLPVHPGVAKYFDLKWTNAMTENCFASEGPLTFKQYCLKHAHYSWNQALAEGIALGLAARYPEAIEKLKAGLERSPRSVVGHVSLGLALNIMGRSAEAIDAARTAECLDRNDYRGPFLQGVALNAVGDFAGATEAFDRAEKVDPGNAELLAWHRNNYGQAGLNELSIRYAWLAEAACPRSPKFKAAPFISMIDRNSAAT